jgi:hypothetical protein
MQVWELLEVLNNVDDQAEVRLAFQPQWAFEYSLETAAATDRSENLEITMVPEPDEFIDADPGWHVVDVSEDPQDEEYWVDGPFNTAEEATTRMQKIIDEQEVIVYLAEGHQIGYLPGEARKAVGW